MERLIIGLGEDTLEQEESEPEPQPPPKPLPHPHLPDTSRPPPERPPTPSLIRDARKRARNDETTPPPASQPPAHTTPTPTVAAREMEEELEEGEIRESGETNRGSPHAATTASPEASPSPPPLTRHKGKKEGKNGPPEHVKRSTRIKGKPPQVPAPHRHPPKNRDDPTCDLQGSREKKDSDKGKGKGKDPEPEYTEVKGKRGRPPKIKATKADPKNPKIADYVIFPPRKGHTTPKEAAEKLLDSLGKPPDRPTPDATRRRSSEALAGPSSWK